MSDAVSFELSGDVAVIRLDDGKANALSPDILAAINTSLDQAEEAGVAVLLTGRPGRFSAGFDLGVMREGGPSVAKAMVMTGAQLALRIARFPAPVVVGSTGHALAMGAVLFAAVGGVTLAVISASGPHRSRPGRKSSEPRADQIAPALL